MPTHTGEVRQERVPSEYCIKEHKGSEPAGQAGCIHTDQHKGWCLIWTEKPIKKDKWGRYLQQASLESHTWLRAHQKTPLTKWKTSDLVTPLPRSCSPRTTDITTHTGKWFYLNLHVTHTLSQSNSRSSNRGKVGKNKWERFHFCALSAHFHWRVLKPSKRNSREHICATWAQKQLNFWSLKQQNLGITARGAVCAHANSQPCCQPLQVIALPSLHWKQSIFREFPWKAWTNAMTSQIHSLQHWKRQIIKWGVRGRLARKEEVWSSDSTLVNQ